MRMMSTWLRSEMCGDDGGMGNLRVAFELFFLRIASPDFQSKGQAAQERPFSKRCSEPRSRLAFFSTSALIKARRPISRV